jgi:hypothetical protein
VSKCNPGNGNAILFWKDRWKEELAFEDFARLYSFAINTDM